MLRECEELLKQAWKLVIPKDPNLKWDRAKADAAVTEDAESIFSAGKYDPEIMDGLEELLRQRMFHGEPLHLWTSADAKYRAMLVLLKHKCLIKHFTVESDKILPIMQEARPLYKGLSGKDPFPEVFGDPDPDTD